MLKLPGQTTVSWAVFDAEWYLATYPDARAELGDADDAAVLQFYLEHGQRAVIRRTSGSTKPGT